MGSWWEELDPSGVWRHFAALLAIPRPSGSETAASDYVREQAAAMGLESLRDGAGNVLVVRPGTGEGVVLQAHLDMVAEKSQGSPVDPSTDPVPAVLRDGWLMSEATTLGADNGIGVAIMLAILESGSRALPPLECLFTVDEERGLLGARVFPTEWLSHRRLINLDSEEENSICIGCAGGRDVELFLDLERETRPADVSLLRVEGLQGGHSGMEIHRGRANAIRLAARICARLGLRVADFSGGTKHNAIPRVACAAVTGGVDRTLLDRLVSEIRDEYSGIEKGISITAEPGEPRRPLTAASSARLVDLLRALPHGVSSMSPSVPGLVQTSCNLATAAAEGDRAAVTLSVRSSVDSSRDELVDRILALGKLAGCSAEAGEGYPGWKPDPASPLLALARQACLGEYRSEPSVAAIHAGLECGIIGKRVGGMDMISMGPDIRDVHIPGERVRVESVASFTRMLTGLLESLA
jgi:dipeptidase D